MQKLNSTITKQKGAVLILMAFIIGIGVLAFLLNSFNPERMRLEQDKKTMQSLNGAKQALIAWAVSHSNAPGQMPWPDRKENVNPDYDGSSDCVNGVYQHSYLIGQLPSLPTTSPCIDPNNGLFVYAGLSTYPSLGQEFKDAQGNRLWYAVSRNLVYDYEHTENPIINPGMISSTVGFAPYLRQGGTRAYAWLQVLDRNANLVSDRVAAVIMAPGNAIGGQDRSGVADPNQFLDSFKIGAATYNNSGYTNTNEDFIMGEDSWNVSATDPTFVQPYNFNDKLVYITIDELIAAVEKRVGEQVRTSLKTYHDTNGYYPYAAHLGTSLSYASDGNLQSGFLPIFQNCSYRAISTTNRTLTCTQPIFDAVTSGITTVRFYLPSGTFTSSTGSCTMQSTNTRCYCTGAGSCSRGGFAFTCNSTSCNAVGTGATGDMRIRDGKLTFTTGGCFPNTTIAQNALGCPISNTNTSRATCNSVDGTVTSYSNGDISFDSFLPAWFKANQWQNYVYYQMTRPASATITVGIRATQAMVATVGRPVNTAPFAASRGAAQVRPSCNATGLSNYLDSAENVSINVPDNIYDATSTLSSANYNDQTFTVAP